MKTKLHLLFFAVLFSVGLHAQTVTVTSTLPSTIETGDVLNFTADYTTDAISYNLIVRFYESDGTTRFGSDQDSKSIPSSTSGSESLSIDAPLIAGNYVAKVFIEGPAPGYAKTFAPNIPFTVTAKVIPVKANYLFNTDANLEGWVIGTTGGGTPAATVTSGVMTFNKGGGAWGRTYVEQRDYKLNPNIHSYVHITYKNSSNNNNQIQLDWITSGVSRSGLADLTIDTNSTTDFKTVSYNLGTNIEWINGGTVADATNLRLYYRQAGNSHTSSGDLIIDSIIFSSSATPPNVFTAAVDNDWSDPANWSANVVPPTTGNILIPADKGVDITNLSVDPTGLLTIESGGSLKVSGTASGNITYNRTVDFVDGDMKGWFLMAAPVEGQDYNDAFVTANDIASKGSNRGIASYTTATDTWVYHQGAASATFTAGKGYSVKRDNNPGTVAFTGTLNVDNAGVTVPLSMDGNRFNLLGNPYPSYLSSATFLNGESAISDTKTMWVFNKNLGVNGQFEVKTVGQDFTIAPGQGFFVKANAIGAVSFNFSEANQDHSATDTFQKTANTKGEVTLSITDGTINNYGKIYYLNNATKGLDIGYDGELFSGQSNDFTIYTHLVSDNKGKNYQVQSLPKSDYENMVVPVGVKAAAGKEITISATSLNLPEDVKVFLEDRKNNVFTNLTDEDFKITLDENLDGVGRFYLRTATSLAVLSTENVTLSGVNIYKTNNATLRIVGLQQGASNVKLYNILGKQMINDSFKANGVKDISLPRLAKGVYIVQLETEAGSLNKKIIIE